LIISDKIDVVTVLTDSQSMVHIPFGLTRHSWTCYLTNAFWPRKICCAQQVLLCRKTHVLC